MQKDGKPSERLHLGATMTPFTLCMVVCLTHYLFNELNKTKHYGFVGVGLRECPKFFFAGHLYPDISCQFTSRCYSSTSFYVFIS